MNSSGGQTMKSDPSSSSRPGDIFSDQFPACLRVLVVDDDPTCLRILDKMFKNCLYQVMSVDDSKNVVMKGVTHGACDYLIKPVCMEALENILQHVVRKKKRECKDNDVEKLWLPVDLMCSLWLPVVRFLHKALLLFKQQYAVGRQQHM